ncbi:peptidylprolyl isomerase [Methylocystis bryophila]|uniref:Parvulin-like PPIase n=1 Tax=Methylocystis bryophila TaxID=655015 RepID=A0A1W6MR03_9HYPH|nr:peptidylprolyl isomerase [Methylocystis bryophila]ARN80023.1 peptidylprolyl isomerase [Methylocystis bryophila]BDV39935.1 peptidylprolyl isomerase [Methylocystis bryophila]
MTESGWNALLPRFAFTIFALGLCLAAAPDASAKVLAKVNGVEITDEDLKLADEYIGSNFSRQVDPKARESALIEFLVSQQLLVQEAQAEKLAETPDFMKRLAYLRDMALMQAMLGKLSKEAITDAAVKKTYEDAAKDYKPVDEYHALHLVVSTEDQAKEALKRIKAGEDFGKVAAEVSKDPGAKNGDLGWRVKEEWLPEFAEQVVKLSPGQVSDPVKTQVGWHVIKLVEKRPRKFPSQQELQGDISRYLSETARRSLLERLKQTAQIERADAPQPPAAGTQKPDEKTKVDDKKK